ncbi:hypothetical protein U1Q18_034427 [Sarracenia purpurea var. burkii]
MSLPKVCAEARRWRCSCGWRVRRRGGRRLERRRAPWMKEAKLSFSWFALKREIEVVETKVFSRTLFEEKRK